MQLQILICILAFCVSLSIQGQSATEWKKGLQFHSVALTTWGAANVTHSLGYGIGSETEAQNFRTMNLTWGAINAGLGILSILEASRPESYFTSNKIRNQKIVFAVNAVLDLGYMASGAFVWSSSNAQNGLEKRDLYAGFGKSLVLQGAALLVLDLVQYYRGR